MTTIRARQVELVILVLAAMALGLEAAYSHDDSSSLLEGLQSLMQGAVTGSLILIAAAFVFRSLGHGIASTLCTLAAAPWAAAGTFEIFSGPPTAGMSPDEVLLVSVCCLALGVLAERLAPRREWVFTASATLILVATIASLATFAATTLTYSTVHSATRPIVALSCVVLCVLGFRQLHRPDDQFEDARVDGLVGPVAIAGIVGTLLAGQIIEHHPVATHAQKVAWMLAASALLMCLTLAAFAIIRLTSEVFVARRLTTKWKRLLARQRAIMHARTKALKRTQGHYKELFANVPAPVLLTHPSGAVIAANPAMLTLLAVESEAALKTTNFVTFYADPEFRRRLIDTWARSDEVVHQGEVLLRRVTGEHRNVLYTSRVVRAQERGNIDYIQSTFTDISDLRKAEATQRRLESDLRLSQKLEAVGRLAAGIAHEINTPMQYIGDNVYFLKQSYESVAELLRRQRVLIADAESDGDGLARALGELDAEVGIGELLAAVPGALSRSEEGIRSINRIVAAMKELAHPGDGGKSSTDVNAVINTAVTVTRNTHKTVATVSLDLGAVPNMLTYKNELCQVLINLIVNAAHAIESAQKTDRRQGTITVRSRADETAIRIDVADNGCGIPDSVIDKIFDPFFTTKEVGKGTGQGLALARTTIVDKHGGRIDVQSSVGVGSTFEIMLPFTAHDSP